MKRKSLSALVEGFYDAALQPDYWHTALRSIQDFTPAAGIVFLNCDLENLPHVEPLLINIDPHGWEVYESGAVENCPRIEYTLRNNPSEIIYDYKYTNAKEVKSSEYYAMLEEHWGVKYFMGYQFDLSIKKKGMLGIHRTNQQGHVNKEDISFFSRIAPHVRRSMQLGYKLETLGFSNQPDKLRPGAPAAAFLLLDTKGRLVHFNEEAEALLIEQDGFTFSRNQISIRCPASRDKFEKALAQEPLVLNLDHSAPLSIAVPIKRKSGKRSYQAFVSRYHNKSNESLSRAAFAIFIYDPEKVAILPQQHLASLYGLSPREAEMAYQLVSNDSLKESAESMFISPNTARVHLRHIFEKTETRSQSELMRLLLTGS